jgi:hypothetical protein
MAGYLLDAALHFVYKGFRPQFDTSEDLKFGKMASSQLSFGAFGAVIQSLKGWWKC